MTRRWFACLLACTATLLSSCLGTRYQPEWVEADVATKSEQVLWEVVLIALNKTRFPVGTGADPAARRVVSGWKTSLAPFKGEGYREKASVEFAPNDSGHFTVKARVERQTNEDIVRPIDPSFADWQDAPDNAKAAAGILQYINSFVGTDIEIGDSPPEGRPSP